MAIQEAILDVEDDDIFAFAQGMKSEVITFLDDMISRARRTKASELE